MTALLIGDSQIARRLLPLLAMWDNLAPPHAKLSEKMGKFMAQSAIDFGRMLKQPRI